MAKDLVEVLKEANQKIDPKLYEMMQMAKQFFASKGILAQWVIESLQYYIPCFSFQFFVGRSRYRYREGEKKSSSYSSVGGNNSYGSDRSRGGISNGYGGKAGGMSSGSTYSSSNDNRSGYGSSTNYGSSASAYNGVVTSNTATNNTGSYGSYVPQGQPPYGQNLSNGLGFQQQQQQQPVTSQVFPGVTSQYYAQAPPPPPPPPGH